MRKIKSLFKRDYEGSRKVFNEVAEGCEWVLNGEGIATRKYDGTAVLIKHGILYKRYDAKNGRTPPDGFVQAQDPDPKTGHWPGWLRCRIDNPSDKYHWEALTREGGAGVLGDVKDGTYELCGPKINGNPEGFDRHVLIPHGAEKLNDCPRTFEEIKEYLNGRKIEGIVWHHPDGRMCKIKRKDFDYTS